MSLQFNVNTLKLFLIIIIDFKKTNLQKISLFNTLLYNPAEFVHFRILKETKL